MQKNSAYSLKEYIGDLAYYIKPYKREFFAGVFFRFTSDLARLYPAVAVSQVIFLLTHRDQANSAAALIQVFIAWGLLTLYFGWAHNTSKFFGYRVAEKASLNIYRDCLAHLFKLDFNWQEAENSGNKMKRIEKGLEAVNTTVRRIFDVLIEVLVNTVGIIVIFFSLEKSLSLALFCFMVIYFVIGTLLLRLAVKQERVVNKRFEVLGGITFETLNNIQTIKALSINEGIMRVVNIKIDFLVTEIKKRIMLFQSRGAILLMFEALFEFTMIIYLAYGIWQGEKELSILILFIGLFGKVSTSIAELTDVTQQLALAKIWMSRAKYILKTPVKIEDPLAYESQSAYPENWQQLKIENLGFTYQKGKTLNNISLNINRGQKVGIVGLSGAGKSTLFKLLLDLYENYTGDITLDGISLKNIRRQSYIDRVAVVLQDTELFDMTLKENIEIAGINQEKLRPELIHEVIHMAHLQELVSQLPQGLETLVGEKGIKLSGGQRQRLGIARALYRQPDILLLDEATSHLDAHSEKEIQKALEVCMQNFTTIVIAHRLSTLKAMDKIVVLHKGTLVEEGTFDDLLAKQGLFAQMWQEQKL